MEIPLDLWPTLAITFGLFLLVGFFAQLVDGAVGMAYGVISSSVLLAFGVPPAQASATLHAAECFTTGASGISHLAHRNVDWRLLFRLAPAGIVGGVAGAYLVTGFDATFIKAIVVAYLGVLGILMLARALRGLSGQVVAPGQGKATRCGLLQSTHEMAGQQALWWTNQTVRPSAGGT